jgi:hypothetical protein
MVVAAGHALVLPSMSRRMRGRRLLEPTLLACVVVAASGCRRLERELLARTDPVDATGRIVIGFGWGLLLPLLAIARALGVPGVVVLPADPSGTFFIGYALGVLACAAFLLRLAVRLLEPRNEVTCISCGWRGPQRIFRKRGCRRCGSG